MRAVLAWQKGGWEGGGRSPCKNLEAIRAVTEMVNVIIFEMMEVMTLQEFQFQQWTEETGWSFWAQIMTPEEARGYRNTLALKLLEEGPDDEVMELFESCCKEREICCKGARW
jgi:hypothetical protein